MVDLTLELAFRNLAGHTSRTLRKVEIYLISLWTVWVLQWVQNFFSSSRLVVLRRFFIVE